MNAEPTTEVSPARSLPPTTIHPLAPFGVQLTAHRRSSVIDLDVEWLHALLLRHKLVTLRGFDPLDQNYFLTAARRFGDLLEWEFGHVLELDSQGEQGEEGQPEGGCAAPLQWDRAFARPVPSLAFLQCLEAPEPGCGGETLFCDTNAVLAQVSSAELAAWRGAEIACRREMRTLRGGEKRRPLVDLHPVTGERILRFDEPMNLKLTDGDAAELWIYQNRQALSVAEAERFLAGIVPRLYQERVCYAHEWREGDFILADNHALLHGRRALKGGRRRLQRVHII
jgi:alpha-ketoglutarate-dependent taurine dioxygenase